MVRYAILGPVELCDGERRVAVSGRRQVALLAFLLVNANRALSNDRLIDALWGDLGSAGALKRLQAAILRLRRLLDSVGGQGELVLRTVAGGYLLAVAPGELDAEIFQARVDDGLRAVQAGEPARARGMLRDALAMWRGPALHEVAYEQFAQSEMRRLEELRMAAVQARVDCELRLGEHSTLIGELEALVAEHPGRERLAEQLMLALYRGGRQGDALDVYARTRTYLSGELGLEPGAAMTTLQRAILEQAPALTLDGVATAPPRRPRHALPRPLQPAVGQLPFTGREQQLAFVAGSWADVAAGARRVVVLAGEAGIGKTRVAAELAARVHDEGALVLYGRCDEGLAVPYQPFVEALRGVLQTVDGDHLRSELGGLAAELGRLLPELTDWGSPAPADAESARFALFEAVVAVLDVATAQQRMLLVIDDVHWAAPATLLLLRHVIRCERPLTLLILVTFRSTELGPDEPLAKLLADLQRDNSAPRIVLGGLDERAIDTLLRAAVGPALADQAAQLGATVHAQTAGNPFFVRELVAHLLETNALTAISEGPAAALLPGKLDIPEGLRNVIGHRVARLSQPARQLMTIASVAASTIDVSLLQALLPENHGLLLDALDEAVAAGLLVESERGEVAFAHALVRQAIYENLSTARRLHLHRRLGEALEAQGNTQKHVEALAHHFAQLALHGETDKAITYAIAAGHAATARLAYEDAAAHFQRGLDILDHTEAPDARRHLDLLLGLGHTHWSTGASDKARHAFKQAADIAHGIGDAAAAAKAALGFSGPFFFEVDADSTSYSEVLLQRALAMLDEHDDTALRARLMGRLAITRSYDGDEHDHRELAYHALAIARRANDKRVLTDVLATCYSATRGPDDPDQHLQMARELTRLAEDVGDLPPLAYGRAWVIGHLLEQGDIDAVLRELDHLEQLAQARNDRFVRWLLAAVQAMLAHIQGQLGHAETFALEALAQWAEWTNRPQSAPAAQVFAVQMIVLRREQGRLEELVELAAANVEQSPDVSTWRCALANIYAELGDRDRAARQLQLLGDLASLPRDAFWLASITLVGTAASFLDDHSRARQAYELLLPHAHTCVVTLSILCEGSTSRPLGMLATTLGRYDDAEQHFEAALEMNARIRSPLWTAHTQYEYVRMLRLRDMPGDHERARTLLTTATATATGLELHALRRRASAEACLAEERKHV
jgi:DNA-binding SARP family transcriptional activator/tetratricopeptide (TPR) repeat protein